MTALLLLALSLPCVYWARGVESRAVLEAAAIKRVDPADLASLGAMLTFLEALPPADLPAVSDLAVVDDGSDVTGK